MIHDKKWEIVNTFTVHNLQFTTEQLLNVLLENRGLKTKKDIEEFLHPKLESVTPKGVGIDPAQLKKTITRIKSAIEKKEQIVIFGDYDVDGITATAILWETLHSLGAQVMPYIPSRFEEGYGLSVIGIENCKLKIANCSLIITVDNGIVANEAVDFANSQGIDVIITDHHVQGKNLPKAYSIVHTTKLCGAGVAYLLSQEITRNNKQETNIDHLSLVALATVADLVPLLGANRTLLKLGLQQLKNTTRPGLLALFADAQIDPQKIDVYAIGHIIAPRLNAMGRMYSAIDSLRLLCTKDGLRAKVLADKLGNTNRERQMLTKQLSEHAITQVKTQNPKVKNLLFIAHESYEEGVIGLIAGKLVEQFYRPAIVISIGEKVSKASARSVSGFNIIEFIRTSTSLLINAGGHPMAAGFTVETEKMGLLQEALEKLAEQQLSEDILTRVLKIDCELPLEYVTKEVYKEIQQLAPFGMSNPEPTFESKVVLKEIKIIGKDKSHLKMRVSRLPITNNQSPITIDAIAFGMGELAPELKIGQQIDIVYTIDENVWNGKTSLQIKVKDIKQN